MTYRVVGWSTGGVGQAGDPGDRPATRPELAGVWVHSEEKDGVDAGTLAGHRAARRRPRPPTPTRSWRSQPDCVCYSAQGEAHGRGGGPRHGADARGRDQRGDGLDAGAGAPARLPGRLA